VTYEIKCQSARRAWICLSAIGLVKFCTVCPAESRAATTSKTKPLAIPTFHCLGVYWSPEQGCEILNPGIPREIEEIEALMRNKMVLTEHL
jgi:hypothetical protein